MLKNKNNKKKTTTTTNKNIKDTKNKKQRKCKGENKPLWWIELPILLHYLEHKLT